MVFADDIRKAILILADQRGPGNLFSSAEVAQLIDPENWIKQVEQVELVAETLVREGQIISNNSVNEVKVTYTKTSLLAENT